MSVAGGVLEIRRERRRRALVVLVLGGIAVLALSVTAMMLGDYPLSVRDVLGALVGAGEGMETTVVWEWRMPRLMAGLVVGYALAVGGWAFQVVTRNPLGSPDLLGVSAGSFTGALLAMLAGGNGLVVFGAALGASGGVVVVMMLLAGHFDSAGSLRFVISGIALTLFLSALNLAILHRIPRDTAVRAAIWGAGTVGDVGPGQLVSLSVGVVLVVGALAVLSGPMAQLQFGRETAVATGVNVGVVGWLVLGAGAALTALVTAATGPIGFVALVAPHIARALGNWILPPWWLVGMVGSLLVVAADLLAQHALDPVRLPVGALTAGLGGIYLLVAILRWTRRR